MFSLFENSRVNWWLHLQSVTNGKFSSSLLREAWLGWRQWWGQSLGAAPDPGMEFLLEVGGSSSGPPASPSAGCTAPSPARCSVEKVKK